MSTSATQSKPIGGNNNILEVIRLRRVHPWMAEAVATPTHVQGGAIAIQLDAGDAGRLTLAVNASDESLVLPGTHHDLDVGPHSWALG